MRRDFRARDRAPIFRELNYHPETYIAHNRERRAYLSTLRDKDRAIAIF